MARVKSIMAICQRSTRQVLIGIVKGYQYLISPLLGPNCRFYPSCSQYAIDAIVMHGLIKGIWLSVKRILRCHPWHEGGIDPVPGSHNLSNRKR